MSIAIVTDSASDLEQGEIDGITVIPLHLHFGDEVFEDGVTLTKPGLLASGSIASSRKAASCRRPRNPLRAHSATPTSN